MERLHQNGIMLACWACLLLAGCINTTVEQRRIHIEPDGSAVLEYITTAWSTNETEVADWLDDYESGDENNRLAEMGFGAAEHWLVHEEPTRVILHSTARFWDWSAFARWLCNGDASCGDRLRLYQDDRQIFFDLRMDEEEESRDELFLSINIGPARIIDTNADAYDDLTGEVSWTTARIATSGLYFWLELPQPFPGD
jgi:hypothetical protein